MAREAKCPSTASISRSGSGPGRYRTTALKLAMGIPEMLQHKLGLASRLPMEVVPRASDASTRLVVIAAIAASAVTVTGRCSCPSHGILPFRACRGFAAVARHTAYGRSGFDAPSARPRLADQAWRRADPGLRGSLVDPAATPWVSPLCAGDLHHRGRNAGRDSGDRGCRQFALVAILDSVRPRPRTRTVHRGCPEPIAMVAARGLHVGARVASSAPHRSTAADSRLTHRRADGARNHGDHRSRTRTPGGLPADRYLHGGGHLSRRHPGGAG